jgi:uroporphyrinogen-III synthase
LTDARSAAPGPLSGLTVVITGSRRATEQSALVSNLGGTPYVVPTVGISLPADDDEVEPFLRKLVEGADYAVFMTATGVRAMVEAAERLGLRKAVVDALNSPRTTVVTRSGKPRGELAKWGVKADASPPLEEATASGILKLLDGRGLKERRVAILWHGSRDEKMRDGLIAAGARDVSECLTYHYSRNLAEEGAEVLRSIGFRYVAPEEQTIRRLVEEVIEGTRKIDALTFTSPPAVANLFEVAAEQGLEGRFAEALRKGGIIVVAVGPSTRSELEDVHGVKVDVMPKVSGMGAMLSALADYAAIAGKKRQEGR